MEKGLFAPKEDVSAPGTGGRAGDGWKVLVVDDDEGIHSVTRLILAKVSYLGRRIALLHAYSAREAREMLTREPDVAVILLDVVMETDDAGLLLVHHIRRELGNRMVRIILRTGQPGQAPEERVIVDYDINDYREKTELTSQKLTTSLISALRSYQDIMAVEALRAGLQRIIDTSNDLFRQRRFEAFAKGVIDTLSRFIPDTREVALIIRQGDAEPRFIGTMGEEEGGALPILMEALKRKSHRHGSEAALYIPVEDDLDVAAFLRYERGLTEVERTLLETLASKIGVGFASVHHYEQLREANEHLEARVAERTRELELVNVVLENLATLDPLTGVFNRRHFDELTKREITRGRRLGRPFAVLMVDIDHFKAINDTHGHATGDVALKVLVRVCRGELRDIDIICRYGGEEFAILLPETRAVDAARVAERLREVIAGEPLPSHGGVFHMTVSIGVSEWRTEEDVIAFALSRADAALYTAKRGGRNRVVAG
ncbi:MAG: diguanylate cyclase [Alphaproteobacteria bacterium]|nr:diguanylate cyclase [Alphaproteobacteria bacterium]